MKIQASYKKYRLRGKKYVIAVVYNILSSVIQ